MGAISTQYSDDTGIGDSRLSTRRNSVITTMDEVTPPTTNQNGGTGNFSIITVFTYTSPTGQLSSSSVTPANEQQQEESKESLEEEASSCQDAENGGNEKSGGGYANRNLMDLMDDPPNYYNALFNK